MQKPKSVLLHVSLGIAALVIGYYFYDSVGIPIALAIGYFLYRSLKSTSQSEDPQWELPKIDNSKFYPIVAGISKLKTRAPINQQPELIKKIYQGSMKLISADLAALIVEQRQRRRKLIKDRKSYVREIAKGEEQKEYLKGLSLNCLLAQVNISENAWRQAVLAWIAVAQDEWMELASDLENLLLQQFVVEKKKLPPLEIIFQTRLRFIKGIDKDREQFKGIPKEELPPIVSQMANDELFMNYAAEREDINAAIEELDQKERQKLSKYLDGISEVYQQLMDQTSSLKGTACI